MKIKTGAALRSAVNVKFAPHIYTSSCSGTVLGCHEAVVRTLSSVSPEVVEETFFLFDCGEWEASCDASSPRDTPGS